MPWSDAPPIVALKRSTPVIHEFHGVKANMAILHSAEHFELQRQSASEHDILQQLRSLAKPDAHRVLNLLRDGEELESVLQFSRGLPAPMSHSERLSTAYRSQNLADGNLTLAPDIRQISVDSLALDSNAGKERPDQIVGRSTNALNLPASTGLPSFDQLT